MKKLTTGLNLQEILAMLYFILSRAFFVESRVFLLSCGLFVATCAYLSRLAPNDVKCGFELLHEIGLALKKRNINFSALTSLQGRSIRLSHIAPSMLSSFLFYLFHLFCIFYN